MKRIYLIGAALILCLFIGGTYFYFANKPATETQNNNYAAIAANADAGIVNSADDNDLVPPVDNNAACPEPQTHSGCVAVGKHVHSSAKVTAPFIDHAAPAEPVKDAKLISYVTNGTGAESSKEYSGNKPANVRRIIRIRPAHNDKPCRLCSIFNGRVGFGPEVGLNQNGITNGGSNMMTGSVHAGLIFNFNLGDNIAFQPGLRYIMKGTRSMSDVDVMSNEKLNMHYLELPADLVVKMGNPNNARFMIGAGPYVSYLLSARDKYSGGDGGYVDVAGAGPAYRTSDIPRLDVGINGFLGCITPEGFYAKAGAELGFRNIQQNTLPGVENNRNYSFLVSVGYIMGGNKK